MKFLALKLIKFYQTFLSNHNYLTCRFYPTCSQYSYQAIEKYGILHGSTLAFQRIIRCHPWSPGGFDPLV